MSRLPCDDEATRSLIGFLALGRLSPDERSAVTGHLRSCASCRAERAEVDSVISILGMLSVTDFRALAAEFGGPAAATARPVPDQLFGAPGAPRPVTEPVRPAGSSHVVRRVSMEPGLPPIRLGEGHLTPRPATGRLARGPHTHRRPGGRRPRTGVVVGLTSVVVIALGGLFVSRSWSQAGGLGPVIAVAATRDDSSGVDVSATLYEQGGQVSVRLAATGLAPGVYQLYAVTDAGEDLLLGRLTGSSGGGTYAGDIPVRVDDLWYFGVREVDGGLIVVATVSRESTPPGEVRLGPR
ncbi:zf-HC2 domain-containing protein [Actinoplanes sp. NBRC 103695]|uniref:zf-HC2 domain-containing protein n=1 Tax=Actinoplanes sp. NBRC 103695 TaxID=3032202 RepID=UPI0024A4DBEB|nr:zf-HC2 domain-containing protein [Actinoplanes sp. NBRC 103695]GLZ01992.1 hypothetical protein Acsp02_92430 [Actinoplanes sp. NBRC 103695]